MNNTKAQIDHFRNRLEMETDSSDLHQSITNNEEIVIVDARSPQSFTKEHIPGAINIHHKIMDEETTKGLNKASLIVTYCDGIGCNASTKGALKLSMLGFTVKELIGGIEWWKKDGYKTHPTT